MKTENPLSIRVENDEVFYLDIDTVDGLESCRICSVSDGLGKIRHDFCVLIEGLCFLGFNFTQEDASDAFGQLEGHIERLEISHNYKSDDYEYYQMF